MQNIEISIIVPVYNKSKYLNDFLGCCDELGKDPCIEIIFIDDGSTDDSWEMLKGYSKTNSTVKCYKQTNSGAGVARNLGIDNSNGRYIAFIDADDLFVASTIKNALIEISENKQDILSYNFRGDSRDKIWPTYYPSAYKYDYLLCPMSTPWGRLFKREFLITNSIRFNNTRTAEDMYFNCYAQCYKPRIKQINETLIIYRTVEGSLSRSIDKNPLAICDSFYEILQSFKKRKFFDAYWQKNLSRYFSKYMIDELFKINDSNKIRLMVEYKNIFNQFDYIEIQASELYGKRYRLIHKLITLKLYKATILALNLIDFKEKRRKSS